MRTQRAEPAVFSGLHGRCDGLHRRNFLRLGALTAFGIAGFGATGPARALDPGRRKRNCILVWLDGGASHLETFDPKPEMPAEVRGPLGSIATGVAGVRFSECLPQLARLLPRMTLLRGMTSPLGEHNLGAHYLMTGYPPNAAVEYPAIGSVAAFLRKGGGDLPAHVAVPHHRVGGGTHRAEGFLPAACAPFEVNRDPGRGGRAGAAGPEMASRLELVRVERRAAWLKQMDRFSLALDRVGPLSDTAGLDQAVRLLTSPTAKKAFDLESEPEAIRNRYGNSDFGQSCLLARRLIEQGVQFVTLNYGGWDTHDSLTVRLKDGYAGARDPVGLVPNLDRGVAALTEDLQSRGLLDETLVLVMGEFGRTPKINPQGGRDHWPRAFSILMAGGGTPAGLVLGRTDGAGESPVERPVSPADLAATVYTLLGFDPQSELVTPDGRPVRLSNGGAVIREITA